MASPLDDRGADAFVELLSEGAKGPRPKSEALEALALRPIWLATWEPRAEGFRTLINSNGEEALAVFSSENELKATAKRFNWLADDGSIATHRAIGGDILRHAWTREYAFVVIDIGARHSLEYERKELKEMLRDLDTTGSFRTSHPPPPAEPEKPTARSSFPPPVERISTMYSMGPNHIEKIEHLSELPTKPHSIPAYESEPPTQPRAALIDENEPTQGKASPAARKKSSRPAHKPKSEPPGASIEEIAADSSLLDDDGTYGAASVIPPAGEPSMPITPSMVVPSNEAEEPKPVRSISSSAPRLNSEAPTAPAAQALPSLEPEKLKLPEIDRLMPPTVGNQPKNESEAPESPEELTQPDAKPRTQKPPVVAPPSIGDGIQLVDLEYAPNEKWLKALAGVLRGFFEVEWASYCEVGRKGADPTPAIGLRITDNYRDNVTAIIKDITEVSRKQDMNVDVLLIDGHDLLRKARERGFVFYPWKPKPFGK